MEEKAANTLMLDLAQATWQGARPRNEDFYAYLAPSQPGLLQRKGIAAVIADGAGDEGQDASHYAVKGFFSDYYSTPDTWDVRQSGERVLRSLNDWLYTRSANVPRSKGYLTTFSAAVICGRELHIFHLGDSRIYLLRSGELEILTRDHVSGAAGGPLVRALGLDSGVLLDYHRRGLQVGDVILMCTDGVHKFVDKDALFEILTAPPKQQDSRQRDSLQPQDFLQTRADNILERVKNNNSTDNATCQLLRVEGLPTPALEELQSRAKALQYPEVLQAGQVLEGYRIQDVAGHGAMGYVYRVRENASGMEYAMKCPRPEWQGSPEVAESFLNEEWVGLRVHSPYLMKAYTPKANRLHYYFLLLEYCPGKTLRRHLDEGRRFSPSEIRSIAAQVCRGLEGLHRLEVVHRDLKPDSIVLSPEGGVKIIDYGIAKIANQSTASLPETKGGRLGSEKYLAPELYREHDGTPQTDVYSLGVTLLEMFTGKLPEGKKGFIPLMEEDGGDCPPWLRHVVGKCIEENAARRYQSASEVLFDLEHPEKIKLPGRFVPLMERNPLRFWKTVAAFLALLHLVWLLWAVGWRDL